MNFARANLTYRSCLGAVLSLFCISVLPSGAQLNVDQLGTFLPFGNKEDRNEQLARTLKNEQELKFRTRVLARRGIVLVEFSLPTCPACDPAAKSIIELISKFGGRVDYVRLDLNKNLGLSYKYDVPEVPAVLLFRDGRLEERYVTFKETNKNELAQSITRLLTEPDPVSQPNSQVATKNSLRPKLTY
jgi:thioredoxin 1